MTLDQVKRAQGYTKDFDRRYSAKKWFLASADDFVTAVITRVWSSAGK